MADGTIITPPDIGMPDPNDYVGNSVLAVGVVTIVLTVTFVTLRFLSKAYILRAVAIEDWFILVALVFAVLTSVGMLLQLGHGLGRHTLYVSPDDVTAYFKISVFVTIIYAIGLLFAKVSLLCLYIRILTYDYLRLAAKILLGIVITTHLWIVGSLFAMCVPLDAFWDFSKRATAYCHGQDVYWSHAGLNVVTDFLIFLLPLTVLHKLRTTRPQKFALYFVFLIAFGVCVISIVRIVKLLETQNNPSPDLMYDGVAMANLTMIEVSFAVVCICLPTLKPILSRFFPRLFSSNQSAQQQPSPGQGNAHERRRPNARRRGTLDTDTAIPPSSTKSPYQSSSEEANSTEMGELPTRERPTTPRDARAAASSESPRLDGLAPPPKAKIRPEPSSDSLYRTAVAGHSPI